MTTQGNGRSPGCFRGYTNEQKTLRAKLDQILKWTRDLKTNIMKQSCKVLQNNGNMMNQLEDIQRQTIDQIHDDLDDYKRRLDRELGRIHDICDALTTCRRKNDEENLRDEILEALRRSPTYSSLEQHIDDEMRPRIRVKPRERIHPGRNQSSRGPILSADAIKRKATQPVVLQVLDTSFTQGSGKRRPQIDSFKRSRSFTNVEHQEAQLGIDYVEEDENDIAWKPFGPKRSVSQTSLPSDHHHREEELSNEAQPQEKQKEKPAEKNDDSSDEEFDVAWLRRQKQKARKEEQTPKPTPIDETPAKRTVRFALSFDETSIDVVELDGDETTMDNCEQNKDQNNNDQEQNDLVLSVIDCNENETRDSIIKETSNNHTQSQKTTNSTIIDDDDAEIIEDSDNDDDDDEIIAISDDESSSKCSKTDRKKFNLTSSAIEISCGNSQSQPLHNPYRVGIADPSLRSIFLPPPPSGSSSSLQSQSGSTTGGVRRNQSNTNIQKKNSRNKRGTNFR